MTSCFVTRSISSMRAGSNATFPAFSQIACALPLEWRRSRPAHRTHAPRSQTRCEIALQAPRSLSSRVENSEESSAGPLGFAGRNNMAAQAIRAPCTRPPRNSTNSEQVVSEQACRSELSMGGVEPRPQLCGARARGPDIDVQHLADLVFAHVQRPLDRDTEPLHSPPDFGLTPAVGEQIRGSIPCSRQRAFPVGPWRRNYPQPR